MIEVRHVSKTYRNGSRKRIECIAAVQDISFSLLPCTSYALVGESGCGKSTLAMLLAALVPPDGGEIIYNGKNIFAGSRKEQRKMRSDIQLVLQNSQDALDPRKTMYQSLTEPLQNICRLGKAETHAAIVSVLQHVELSQTLLTRYPHELSGGQQSRICIARALCVQPKYIIFDESTSGLDCIVRKKILDLLRSIQKTHGITYLFITHDIDVARYMTDRIFVMHAERILKTVFGAQGEQLRQLL